MLFECKMIFKIVSLSERLTNVKIVKNFKGAGDQPELYLHIWFPNYYYYYYFSPQNVKWIISVPLNINIITNVYCLKLCFIQQNQVRVVKNISKFLKLITLVFSPINLYLQHYCFLSQFYPSVLSNSLLRKHIQLINYLFKLFMKNFFFYHFYYNFVVHLLCFRINYEVLLFHFFQSEAIGCRIYEEIT